MGRNEATPTTPPTRAQKMGEEETSSNPKGPSRVSRGVRNKAVHKRTNSAGGEKEVSVSPSKKMTGASEEGPSKKTDRLLTAKFESLSETDRVKRVKMNSEKIMKVKHTLSSNLHSDTQLPLALCSTSPHRNNNIIPVYTCKEKFVENSMCTKLSDQIAII